MTEVLFYHLTESKLEDALPGLLERSIERNWHVVVQTGTEERRDALDQHLWTYSEESFLAHACDNEDALEQTPIVLTTEQHNPNNATVRFLVDGAVPGPLESYTRAIFMFDGHDEAQVEDARLHWKALKSQGHDLTYWQQNAESRWEKKA
ncbi:MAG: DNA polymerase III subunit chi [Rhizobiaceae bacterium]